MIRKFRKLIPLISLFLVLISFISFSGCLGINLVAPKQITKDGQIGTSKEEANKAITGINTDLNELKKLSYYYD